MDRVVFLDRDGTINEEVEYLHRPQDLRLLPGAAEAIGRLRKNGLSIVVVTNQAGVARGYYEEEDVIRLHRYLNERLKEQGTLIDHFFYCPHHPEHGIGKYLTDCQCRKPKTGLFAMAEAFYQVDKAHSYMVGDKLLDVEAGRRYGVRPVLVGTGYGKELASDMTEEEKKRSFEHYAPDLLAAADWIIEAEQRETCL